MNNFIQSRIRGVVSYKNLFILLVILLIFILINPHIIENKRSPNQVVRISESESVNKNQLVKSYGKIPMHFEENLGQIFEEVKFLSHGPGYTVFLLPQEAVLKLKSPKPSDSLEKKYDSQEYIPKNRFGTLMNRPGNQEQNEELLSLKLNGSNPNPIIEGMDKLTGKSNYFISNDSENWYTDIHNYRKVRYTEVYPGIDLIYYGNQRRLEYDFIVAPHADPSPISIRFGGADHTFIDDGGNLILKTNDDEVVFYAPEIYQEFDDKKNKVEGSYYYLDDQNIGFIMGPYDEEYPLIIDPKLSYSTYLGGSSVDIGWDIAVDTSGNAYVAGETQSSDFPSIGAVQKRPGDVINKTNIFLSKINPEGTALIYSTYIGGNNWETAYGIAVDLAGNAYITGPTRSQDFPTLNAFDAGCGTDGLCNEEKFYNENGELISRTDALDGYVTKINPEGNGLVFSTFIGGGEDEYPKGIAVDQSNNVYVGGYTASVDFPTVNPYQTFPGDYYYKSETESHGNIFVSKFNAMGNGLVFSTYIGGNWNEGCEDIAIDSSGNVYLTGSSISTDFPTVNPYQSSFISDHPGWYMAIVSKLDSSGSSLIYSTYLGGDRADFGYGIAVDKKGCAYVTGSTFSSNFPVQNAIMGPPSGVLNGAGFITKFSPSGNSLIYSSYLTGSDNSTEGYGVAVDEYGNAYISGRNNATDFPITDPIKPGVKSQGSFVYKLDPSGGNVLYSTCLLNGFGWEGNEIAVDQIGNMYLTGVVSPFAQHFPTLNAFQSTIGGENDAFVVKIEIDETGALTVTPDAIIFPITQPGETSVETVEIASTGNVPVEIKNIDVEPIPLFGFEEEPETPLTLKPGEKIEFQVTYSPELARALQKIENVKGSSDGALVIVSDAKNPIISVPIETTVEWKINFDGVAIDLENPIPGVFPNRSNFIGFEVSGKDLEEVDEIVFDPPDDILVSNIDASLYKVEFELSVLHTADLGERNLILKTSDASEIKLSDILGKKFIITRVRTQFNQAIDARYQNGVYMDKLVAQKDGVVRIQFDDENQNGKDFGGELNVTGISSSAYFVDVHTPKAVYSDADIINGRDFLTIPFPKPFEKGKRTFFYRLLRNDGREILGAPIEREIIESVYLRILGISYKVKEKSGTFLDPPSDAEAMQAMELLKRFYPISANKVQFSYLGTDELPSTVAIKEITTNGSRKTVLAKTGELDLVNHLETLLKERNERALESNKPTFHFIVAFLPEIGSNWYGKVYFDYRAAMIATKSNIKSLKKVVPHEIGHVIKNGLEMDFDIVMALPLGVDINNFGDEYEDGVFYCDVNPAVKEIEDKYGTICSNSPFSMGISGDATGTYTDLSAYDPVSYKPKFTDKNLTPSVIHYNFMSSTVDAKAWVSKRVYSKLLEYLLPVGANEEISLLASKTGANSGIQIKGVIYNNNTAYFNNFHKTSSYFRSEPSSGPYSIEIQDGSGNVLTWHSFDVDFIDISEPPVITDRTLFSVFLDLPEGSKNVILKKDGVDLVARTISDNSPVVQILEPQGGMSVSGNVTVRWTAKDQDNDSLTYTILYAPNEDQVLPVISSLTDTTYIWNSSNFPGGTSAKLIVIASDGVNTGEDETDIGFNVPLKGPFVQITSPEDNAAFSDTAALILAASGYDAEDGILPDSGFVFSSNVDGHLGTGSPLILNDLSGGSHTIRVQVSDSDGNTAADSITISYTVTSVEGSETGPTIPANFVLYQNYPNPFNSTTSIRFDLPSRSHVTLKVYNILGAEVANLVNEHKNPGRYEVTFNTQGFASGVYFYRLETRSFTRSKKMLLIK